jgi:hypothetical protein
MKRRAFAFGLQGFLWTALLVPAQALAQRPAQPIYRPTRPGRPDRPYRPGRFDTGGVNYGSSAGVFTVVSLRTRDHIVRLRDDAGNAADVVVNERLFDIDELKPGDIVAVDFFVGGDNDDQIQAASIEKLELVPQ